MAVGGNAATAVAAMGPAAAAAAAVAAGLVSPSGRPEPGEAASLPWRSFESMMMVLLRAMLMDDGQ